MKKIGFLLSGNGSTLKNLLDFQNSGQLKGRVSVVISSKSNAHGLEIAKDYQIPSYIVEYKNYSGKIKEYSAEITSILKKYQCDIVVMGGFLSFYEVPKEFENKVLNIHPSLIPAFCGGGYYGKKVYEKILEHGVKIAGCTVHLVNNQYDNGPILEQGVVPVLDDDTAESLSERVQEMERMLFPKTINDFLEDQYIIVGNKTRKKKRSSQNK